MPYTVSESKRISPKKLKEEITSISAMVNNPDLGRFYKDHYNLYLSSLKLELKRRELK